MLEFSVSDFVALLNQTLEYAYPEAIIIGELANFKVAKNKWLFFDLKDEGAKLAFFGSVYKLPGPLEDGMMIKVHASPRLHPAYGFRLTVNKISLVGIGTIHRVNQLLTAKLEAEGLFLADRKRTLAYPPTRIGLITSMQSAAFADFTKVVNQRWGGLEIDCYDVSVQGDDAPGDIVHALEYFSAEAYPPDVVVIIRGGGSPEDLAAFNNETVTRAIAASRVPTLVAIGHENDLCLAEMAADLRGSTPSNAAELLVPDKKVVQKQLENVKLQLNELIKSKIGNLTDILELKIEQLPLLIHQKITTAIDWIKQERRLLHLLSPKKTLDRGYAIIYKLDRATDGSVIKEGDNIQIETAKYIIGSVVNNTRKK